MKSFVWYKDQLGTRSCQILTWSLFQNKLFNKLKPGLTYRLLIFYAGVDMSDVNTRNTLEVLNSATNTTAQTSRCWQYHCDHQVCSNWGLLMCNCGMYWNCDVPLRQSNVCLFGAADRQKSSSSPGSGPFPRALSSSRRGFLSPQPHKGPRGEAHKASLLRRHQSRKPHRQWGRNRRSRVRRKAPDGSVWGYMPFGRDLYTGLLAYRSDKKAIRQPGNRYLKTPHVQIFETLR